MHLNVSRLAPLIGAFLGSTALLVVPQLASAAPSRVAVIEVGGLDSKPDSTNWSMLEKTTGSSVDWLVYSYTGWNSHIPYTSPDTCQPLATSEAVLKQEIDSIRGQYAHVILLGHSLGGVLAFDVGSRDDEADFVSKIVTVDAPLGGISGVDHFLSYLDPQQPANCAALDQVRTRAFDPSWQTELSTLANGDLAKGQQLMIVSNDADVLMWSLDHSVLLSFITGAPVNYEWNVPAVAGSNTHDSVFHDPASVQQIAHFITASGWLLGSGNRGS